MSGNVCDLYCDALKGARRQRICNSALGRPITERACRHFPCAQWMERSLDESGWTGPGSVVLWGMCSLCCFLSSGNANENYLVGNGSAPSVSGRVNAPASGGGHRGHHARHAPLVPGSASVNESEIEYEGSEAFRAHGSASANVTENGRGLADVVRQTEEVSVSANDHLYCYVNAHARWVQVYLERVSGHDHVSANAHPGTFG